MLYSPSDVHTLSDSPVVAAACNRERHVSVVAAFISFVFWHRQLAVLRLVTEFLHI